MKLFREFFITSYERLWAVRTDIAAKNMVYWNIGGKAGSIETTSYALLASVRRAKSQRKCTNVQRCSGENFGIEEQSTECVLCFFSFSI